MLMSTAPEEVAEIEMVSIIWVPLKSGHDQTLIPI